MSLHSQHYMLQSYKKRKKTCWHFPQIWCKIGSEIYWSVNGGAKLSENVDSQTQHPKRHLQANWLAD